MVPTHLSDKHRESGQDLQREPPQTVRQQRQEHLVRPALAQADPRSVRSQKAVWTSGWRKSMTQGAPSSAGCYLTAGIGTQREVRHRACRGPAASRGARAAPGAGPPCDVCWLTQLPGTGVRVRHDAPLSNGSFLHTTHAMVRGSTHAYASDFHFPYLGLATAHTEVSPHERFCRDGQKRQLQGSVRGFRTDLAVCGQGNRGCVCCLPISAVGQEGRGSL